jgi:hypothetical protein
MQIRNIQFDVSIDFTDDKKINLDIDLFTDDIKELIELQERFTQRNIKGFFKYLAEKV